MAMMKTFLVLIEGNAADLAVLESAFTLAKTMNGHVDALHVSLAASDAAEYAPNSDFARGDGLRNSLQTLHARAETSANTARQAFVACCERYGVIEAGSAGNRPRLTARWHTETSEALERLIETARHRDLVIAGHPSSGHLWPRRLIESLLIETGRPLLLIPPGAELRGIRTVTLCWKEDAPSARALTAALPLLLHAKKLGIVTVREGPAQTLESGRDLAEQLARHGMDASAELLWESGKSPIGHLRAAAAAQRADLMVMGAFSHSRTRELLFGGCTQAALDGIDRPVFLLH